MKSGAGPDSWYQSIRLSDSVDLFLSCYPTHLMLHSTSRVMARLQRFPIVYSSVLMYSLSVYGTCLVVFLYVLCLLYADLLGFSLRSGLFACFAHFPTNGRVRLLYNFELCYDVIRGNVMVFASSMPVSLLELGLRCENGVRFRV